MCRSLSQRRDSVSPWKSLSAQPALPLQGINSPRHSSISLSKLRSTMAYRTTQPPYQNPNVCVLHCNLINLHIAIALYQSYPIIPQFSRNQDPQDPSGRGTKISASNSSTVSAPSRFLSRLRKASGSRVASGDRPFNWEEKWM